MTPEQFMDCRLALRALRRVKRWCEYRYGVPVAIGDMESAIWAALKDLPEYAAMMAAKRRVRERVRLQNYHTVKSGLVKVFGPTIADRCTEYREAREKFLERIGGEE